MKNKVGYRYILFNLLPSVDSGSGFLSVPPTDWDHQSKNYYHVSGWKSPNRLSCVWVYSVYWINAQSASFRSLLAAESRAEQRAQVEIASWQKLLRPKSPVNENSSGRNLRTKTSQAKASGKCSSILFAPPPSPSPSNKAGWAFSVNCSEINMYFEQQIKWIVRPTMDSSTTMRPTQTGPK